MALHWNASETEAWKEVEALDTDDPKRRAYGSAIDWLVWKLLVVEYPGKTWGITEANVDELWDRLWVYCRINDFTMRMGPGQLRQFIGLSTNIGNTTPLQYGKAMMKIAMREAKEAREHLTRKNEAA